MSADVPGPGGGFAVSFAAGSRIAGYRLEEQIGRGGMAVVFRARDEQLGRLVALKILAPALAGDTEFQRRFTSESRADEFTQTVTFSFRIGDDAYYWDWNSCIKDTEPEDGIGLPGHHGCGDPRVLDSASYLG